MSVVWLAISKCKVRAFKLKINMQQCTQKVFIPCFVHSFSQKEVLKVKLKTKLWFLVPGTGIAEVDKR